MILAAFAALILQAPAVAQERKPKTSQELLEYSLGRVNAPKVKNVNAVATAKSRTSWFNHVGTELSQEHTEAVRKMIEASDCKFVEPSLAPAEGAKRANVTVECAGKREKKIQCSSLVNCRMPGLEFNVGAICLAASDGSCPPPKDCALRSAFDVKLENNGYADNVFRSMWIGGQSVEPK